METEFRILGPLEVRVDGSSVPLGGAKQRALLALLILSANEPLSSDRLIDALWGERPPSTAANTLQVHLSRLRRSLAPRKGGDPVLVRRGDGYALQVAPEQIDLHRFERLVSSGRQALAAGDATRAAAQLHEALELWRGEPLADLAYEPAAQTEVARLQQLRLEATKARIDADLSLGRQAGVAAELEALVRNHPHDERLRAQQMLALYRCGRQADALAAFDAARRALDELGLEPGGELRWLQLAILRHEPTLAPPEGRPPGTYPPHEETRPRARPRWAAAAAAGVLVTLAAAVAVVTREPNAPAVPPNSVVIIDPQGNEVVAHVPVGIGPGPIAGGLGYLWVANTEDWTISQIDPEQQAVTRTIPLEARPTGLAVGADAVWVANGSDGSVSRIDPRTGRVAETIPVTRRSVAPATSSGAVTVAGGDVWAVFGNSVVARIDSDTGTVVQAGYAGTNPLEIGFGATDGWEPSPWVAAAGELARIDPHSATPNFTTAVAPDPRGIAFGHGSVWVTTHAGDALVRIRGTTIRTIEVGDEPAGVAVAADAVWAASSGSRSVARVDPATNEVVHRVDVVAVPDGVAVADRRVWVTVR